MVPSAAAIIPAAGIGSRMGLDEPKQYCLLAGIPIIVHTVRPFLRSRFIKTIIIVVPRKWLDRTRELLAEHLGDDVAVQVIPGGKRRQDSVLAGLRQLGDDIDIVLVHDGARPMVTTELIDRCYRQCIRHGAVIAAVPVKDTIKKCDEDNRIMYTVPRQDLWQAQTPQAARLELLKNCYAKFGHEAVTDEASLLELGGIPVTVVEGSETNIKITRPEDLVMAEKMMEQEKTGMRIGHGFDAHRFQENRDLVLAGVKIAYSLGLAGHSDADVLTHAVCDAVLGAIGEGDIGKHFPDSDNQYKNISSLLLLESVIELARKKGFGIINIDVTVICQEPKLSPYLDQMREKLARSCLVENEQVNIGATTTEKWDLPADWKASAVTRWFC